MKSWNKKRNCNKHLIRTQLTIFFIFFFLPTTFFLLGFLWRSRKTNRKQPTWFPTPKLYALYNWYSKQAFFILFILTVFSPFFFPLVFVWQPNQTATATRTLRQHHAHTFVHTYTQTCTRHWALLLTFPAAKASWLIQTSTTSRMLSWGILWRLLFFGGREEGWKFLEKKTKTKMEKIHQQFFRIFSIFFQSFSCHGCCCCCCCWLNSILLALCFKRSARNRYTHIHTY